MSDIKNEFPLYPELSEQGNIEAVKLIEKFKKQLSKAADEAIGDLYCDVIPHIESDSWSNFRNDIVISIILMLISHPSLSSLPSLWPP